jgi:nitrate/nitrite transport system substrate-binding protein
MGTEAAKKVNEIALYKEAAAQVKAPIPKNELRESKLIDGVVWNAKDPKAYADGFKVKG